jgi:hypothetical protein
MGYIQGRSGSDFDVISEDDIDVFFRLMGWIDLFGSD